MEDQIDLLDGSSWGHNPQDELRWLRPRVPARRSADFVSGFESLPVRRTR